METSRPDPWRRKSDVDPFFLQSLCQGSLFEPALLPFVLAFEVLLYLVEELPDSGAFFRCELSEFFADPGKRSFSPQCLDTDLFETFDGNSIGKGG